jgi:hypothetical protein
LSLMRYMRYYHLSLNYNEIYLIKAHSVLNKLKEYKTGFLDRTIFV